MVRVEMAQAHASLGSRVTLLEGLPRLLAREEPSVSDEISAALGAAGVDVRTDVTVTAVTRHADGAVTVTPADGTAVVGDELLVAVGDVNGRSLLTHMGKYQARVAADVIDGADGRATRDREGAPRVVFADPQVAAVGLTEAEARRAGLDPMIVTVAVVGAVPMHVLLESVAPFPTRSEIWLKLLERYEVQRRLGGLARAA